MRRNIRFGTIPAGNPLANALMFVVGTLAIGAAIVLGFFAFIVLAGIVLVLAAIVGIRLWWFNRKLRKQAAEGDELSARRKSPGRVIEGEYTVVSSRSERQRRDEL